MQVRYFFETKPTKFGSTSAGHVITTSVIHFTDKGVTSLKCFILNIWPHDGGSKKIKHSLGMVLYQEYYLPYL